MFALPIAVLVYFMNISFDYDIEIGRTEIRGNNYLRNVVFLLDRISEYRLKHFFNKVAEDDSHDSGQIDKSINYLIEAHSKLYESFKVRGKNHAKISHGYLDPHQLKKIWNDLKDNPADQIHYNSIITALRSMVSHIGDSSGLTLDPVLDSSYLIDVLIKIIPNENIRVADILFQGLHKKNIKGHCDLSEYDRIGFRIQSELLRKDGLERVVESSYISLTEDKNYYSYSPSLHNRYLPALKKYTRAAAEFIDLIENLDSNNMILYGDEFLMAGSRMRKAGFDLFTVGSEELNILIEKRIKSYNNWRWLGIICSLTAIVLASLMIYSISRDVTDPIKSIIQYTKKISSGDYNAVPDNYFCLEMLSLSMNIKTMVEEIKHRMGYSDGILNSIATPFVVVDTEGRITFINKAMSNMLELDKQPHELTGNDAGEMFYDAVDERDFLNECLNKGRCLKNLEIEIHGKKGTGYHVSIHTSPLHDFDGNLIGATTFVIDLTDLKRREAEISVKNNEIVRLAAFPRENPAPVMACDHNGNITYRNTATENFLSNMDMESDKNFLPRNHKHIIQACLKSGGSKKNIETEIKEKVLSWHYNPLPSHNIVHIYVEDITERKLLERQLRHDAFHDTLTGLPNRALFIDRLDLTLERAKTNRETRFAVLFLDMDRFKRINDSLGHSKGDLLLKSIAKRLSKVLHPGDTIARNGGDEFTVLLENINTPEEALRTADTLKEALEKPFKIDDIEIIVTMSTGIYLGTGNEEKAEDILRDSDTAMYGAKAAGGAGHMVFDEDMHKSSLKRFNLEIELRKSVENKDFIVYYQPLVSLQKGYIYGFEALVRWKHPERGIVSPGEFIPLSEETGLIIPVGRDVLRDACLQTKKWQTQGYGVNNLLTISVNLSVKQFNDSGLLSDLDGILSDTGLHPESLKLEITESGLMENADYIMNLLNEFKRRGIKLGIDDFGTGYSSLSYLHRFPFDTLKIDRSFVMMMEKDDQSLEIVKTIIYLTHALKKDVIAEGIEELTQLKRLRELNCEYGQGYYFAKPLEAEKAEELLKGDPKWY